MEIREDFKVDFDSWKKEAIAICKKSIPFIFVSSFLIPSIVYFLYDLFRINTTNIGIIHYPIGSFLLVLLTMLISFYTLFHFKRVDFNEPRNIINLLRDIINTRKNFLEYWKIHIVFTYIMVFLSVITVCLYFFSEVDITYKSSEYLTIISTSLLCAYISFYVFLCSSKNYIFGIIYIGYGMVNKEGAKILTKNATTKYPELEKFVNNTASKFSAIYMLSLIVILIFRNYDIVIIFIVTTYIIYSVYHVAIYYLISRDLYAGKPLKQKATVEVEDFNATPVSL